MTEQKYKIIIVRAGRFTWDWGVTTPVRERAAQAPLRYGSRLTRDAALRRAQRAVRELREGDKWAEQREIFEV